MKNKILQRSFPLLAIGALILLAGCTGGGFGSTDVGKDCGANNPGCMDAVLQACIPAHGLIVSEYNGITLTAKLAVLSGTPVSCKYYFKIQELTLPADVPAQKAAIVNLIKGKDMECTFASTGEVSLTLDEISKGSSACTGSLADILKAGTLTNGIGSASAASSEEIAREFNEIKHQIEIQGAKWTPSTDFISKLTPEEKANLVSHIEPRKAPSEPPTALGTTQLPSSFDWRNHNGQNWMTSVKNQGGCGSCWAFAAVGATEAKINIDRNNPYPSPDLSEQDLISCSSAGTCGGGGGALDFIRHNGIVPESCFPYTASDSHCSERCSDWQNELINPGLGTYYVNGATKLKRALIDDGPPVILFKIYGDFFYYSSGIYSHVSGSLMGYHNMPLVGYDDVGKYWIVKNSWGTGWGESGYAKIADSNPDTSLNIVEYYGEGLTQNKTLSVYKIDLGLGTVISSPAGINCGTDCLKKYLSGEEVTLFAEPTPGSQFAGWGGDCSGVSSGNPCTLQMYSAKVVGASFTVPLTVSVSHSPAEQTAGRPVTITASAANDAGLGKIELYVDDALDTTCEVADGATESTCTDSITYSDSGVHTYYAFAYDTSGNRDSASETNSLTIIGADTEAPETTLQMDPVYPVNGQTVTITATATDNYELDTLALYFDGGLLPQSPWCTIGKTWGTCTYTLAENLVRTGETHTYGAIAKDVAGNIAREPATGTKSFTVAAAQAQPPAATVSVTHVPASPFINQPIKITATSTPTTSAGLLETSIYIDNAWVKTCPQSLIYTAATCEYTTSFASAGTHIYKALAYGAVSHSSPAVDSKSFTVIPPAETTPPTLMLTATPDTQRLRLTASVHDNAGVASVDIYLDGAVIKTCYGAYASGCSISLPVSVGVHTYKAVAIDTSYNKAYSPGPTDAEISSVTVP